MSPQGQSLPNYVVRAMSAYPPTPDILLRCGERSKLGPGADIVFHFAYSAAAIRFATNLISF